MEQANQGSFARCLKKGDFGDLDGQIVTEAEHIYDEIIPTLDRMKRDGAKLWLGNVIVDARISCSEEVAVCLKSLIQGREVTYDVENKRMIFR